MANFTRNGYGQVEPNQLSAQKTGQIYASLPLDPEVKVLQNGEFMFYDYSQNKVTATESGVTGQEPMLVFNEIKLYDELREHLKDFAMIRVGDNYVTTDKQMSGYGDGSETKGAKIDPAHSAYQAGYRMDGIAPRLLKTNVGDIFTTNMVKTNDTYAVKDILKLKKTDRNTLELDKAGDIDTIQFVVAKVYTMPDGQPGLKVQRIK